jgi:hypothetical protein
MSVFHHAYRLRAAALAAIVFSVAGIFNSASAQQIAADGPGESGRGELTVIEASTGNGEILRSTDGGRSWTRITKEEAAERQAQLARSIDAAGLSSIIKITSITSVDGSVTIRYELRQAANIELAMCQVNGGALFTSNEGTQGPGSHSITVDASALPKGIYCYRIMSGGSIATTGKLLMDR